MAAENKSLGAIAHELSNRGIKTATGKEWRKQNLAKIIKNPFYKGYIFYANETHKGEHSALIDEKLWDKANKFLVSKIPGHKFTKTKLKYTYLLSGLLKCSKCGSYLVSIHANGRHGKKFFYYHCSRGRQKLGCNASPLSATAFDSAVIEYFKTASKNQNLIIKAIGNAIIDAKEKLSKIDKNIIKIEKELDNYKKEGQKLLDLVISGLIEKEASFKEKMKNIDSKIIEIENELDKLQAKKRVNQMSANSGEFLHSNIKFVMTNIDKVPDEIKKNLLKSLIKEIHISEKSIEIRMFLEHLSDNISVSDINKKSLEVINSEAYLPDQLNSSSNSGSTSRIKWHLEVDARRTTHAQTTDILVNKFVIQHYKPAVILGKNNKDCIKPENIIS